MGDLVERLRACGWDNKSLPDEAADEIERQAKRIEELESAIRDADEAVGVGEGADLAYYMAQFANAYDAIKVIKSALKGVDDE